MNKIHILLISIVILASFLRIYKLDTVPPSISWDEAANGYNAYTIANFGRDEYGKFFPAYFRSFADDKHPTHIYITAIFVKFFGLNEITIRLPSAVFGTLNVLLLFLLTRLLFKKDEIALAASFFLAISPYNIHFSRFNHEANFALFFFMLGLTLFYLFLKRRGIFLPLSILSFGVTFITYHTAKIIVPITIFVLTILYIKEILHQKNSLIASFIIIAIFAILIFLNPQLLGFARFNQTIQNNNQVEKTWLFQRTKNVWLGRINLIATQYSWHFSPEYLFISGDKNPRLSSQVTGEFYKIDAIFLILGVVYVIYKRTKESLIVLFWAFLAPLPSSLVAEAPHAARASFMMGSWHLIAALGFYFIMQLVRKAVWKVGMVMVSVGILTSLFINYLNGYYGEYTVRYAIDWQYGMKQVVEYVKMNGDKYEQVYMTDIRSQPYIFFLFYLKTSLPEYLNTVIYNRGDSKSFSTVSIFDKYYFGGWDPIESMPYRGVLYVVSPSEYDGLRHKDEFDVKKIIYYPNGTDAFFIVSSKL
ncbi:MAG: glycosyltransferase family 39 protein [Candidatus Daviesbacteria bacterium]|nr:glycosyltransferase family 39 protein [Candidatus Daviesbacteria bacterium]